jgi:hypothetical protein
MILRCGKVQQKVQIVVEITRPYFSIASSFHTINVPAFGIRAKCRAPLFNVYRLGPLNRLKFNVHRIITEMCKF